jgi:caffeoyl-CoA O-methyltransferase
MVELFCLVFMNLLDSALSAYADAHTSPPSQLLKEIERDTYLQVLMPQMVSGHLQGRLLSFLSKLLRPQYILEIGTFTGYSALCLAEGLAVGGKLVTIDRNKELEDRVRGYFQRSDRADQLELHIGNAHELIPSFPYAFDMAFIDADKERYPQYYTLVMEKLRPGGIILADNVLRDGKVLDPSPDKDTRAIQAFNEMVNDDPRVEQVLLPVRDGLTLIRRRD